MFNIFEELISLACENSSEAVTSKILPLDLTNSPHGVDQFPSPIILEDSLFPRQLVTRGSEGGTHGLGEDGGQVEQSEPVGGGGVLHDVGPDDGALLSGSLGDVLGTAGLLPAMAGDN